jgi:succinate dehydrogenase/fumarate reductase flavoprotein subunit
VLGTGGAGKLFLHNLNPPDITGDGYALGYRAGAELVNMEFMQTGPSIVHPVHNILNTWLLALDPRLTNVKGEKFLDGIVQKACQFLRTYYAHRGLGARGVP